MRQELDHDSPLYRMRHSLAHILAQAVMEYRPGTQLGFGPPTENGFYYDFLLPEPIAPEDLPAIEKLMRKIIGQNQPFEFAARAPQEAYEFLEGLGQTLKREYAEDLVGAQGESQVTFYSNGTFVDMCEGPHVEATGKIPAKAFALDAISGAYWRADDTRPQMTRIYGLAFPTDKELNAFLERRRLAQERDHRKLGRELGIFMISDEVGPGLPLWLPHGATLREEMERFSKEMEFRGGYVRVNTPHISKEQLFYTSGHLPYYKDTMFPPMQLEGESAYYLKPMNCPMHHLIYGHEPRSYRDLPLRLAEWATNYRYEMSGALAGLVRVRGMHMNDAHIYCRVDQLHAEFTAVLELHKFFYEYFRLGDFWMRLSLHDPKNTVKYLDNPDAWAFTEKTLRDILVASGLPYEEAMDEAAFYGPKVDFQIQNVVGREETASTGQLDFGGPLRFDLEYVDEHGQKQRPYIIHRAPLGTHERFLSFLIEHFGGAFPTWMAPVQVRLVPVAEPFVEYAQKLAASLRNELFRAEVDDSHDSFNKRIRNATIQKIPNVFVIGGKEAETESVTWRRYGHREQATRPVEEAFAVLRALRAQRVMDNFPDVELPPG